MILISGIAVSTIAQSDYDYDEKEQTGSLFLNSTALLHPKLNGLVLGGEYRWKPNFGINQQLGFIYTNFERLNSNFINTRKRRGFRSSSELRWYRHAFDRTIKSHYLGLQFRYWNYNETGEYEFCRENCQYQQFLEYDLRQYAIGMGISRGAIRHWGKHFFMDYGVSFGAMFRKNQTDLPEDARPVSERLDINKPNPENFENMEAYFLFYIKLGYSF